MHTVADARLFDAMALLGERSLTGFVWVDAALTVLATHGRLAAAIEIGRPALEALPVLVGQEARIAALTAAPGDALVLPNVALMTAGDTHEPVRLDIGVYAMGAERLIVLGRVLGAGEIERLVENEIRQRRIADAELARIVAQLEEFTYVISHDLMAPLRAMRFFAGEAIEALDTTPPDLAAARTHAADVATQTRRMSSMLQGLLAYARIGRRHEAVEATDTARLVGDVVRGLDGTQGATIVVEGAWPVLVTAPAALDLVLRNLLDNALKHHDRPDGRIVAAGTKTPLGWRFSVTDDGPGIPAEWHEAIFQPFRRIDDRAAADSSGIGLALVRRTVEGIGGRIRVQSTPERCRGTTFIVTWPAG
jgi:signal transduction histidine kinase